MTAGQCDYPRRDHYLKLQDCYDRLEKEFSARNVDARRITELVEEADRIIKFLSLNAAGQAGEAGTDGKSTAGEREILESLRKKARRLEELFKKEMAGIEEAISNLKTGRRAINAYHPPRVGMGYTEGKFVDRKE